MGKQKNGELLGLAAINFDVLLTNDKNIEHQQNTKNIDLAFVVLVAPTNDIVDLTPLMSAANKAIETVKPGEFIYISIKDTL